MITNPSYLFNQHGADYNLSPKTASLLPAGFFGLRLVVPRALCVVFRANCAGVPRWSLRGFAQLQAEQFTPFQNFGVCAVKQGQNLHLWLCDKTLEEAFAEKHGGRPARQVVPQSLLSQPINRGVQWLRHSQQEGLEAQLWNNHLLLDSLYFQTPPTADKWDTLMAQQPDLLTTGWSATLPAGSHNPATEFVQKAWARNLLNPPLRLPRLKVVPIARVALWASTAVLAAGTAATLTERATHQNAIAEGVESQKKRLADLEPLQQARDAVQSLERWLVGAQALAPSPSKLEIMNEIATLVTRQGLVVRELEVTPPTISATLVPATGSDIRLTAVIGAVEANPLFTDARFIDVSGGNAFKFTWRMRSSASRTSAVQGPRP